MSIINQLNNLTPQDLSLRGQAGPTFETEGQRTTSDIQALVQSGILIRSQDLLVGRTVNVAQPGWVVTPGAPRRFSAFAKDQSDPPVSIPNAYVGRPYYPPFGLPGRYQDFGPSNGRY